ncbi:MAG TPA: hypothetical protein VNY04_02835 [Chthoniobacterales bacterium]|nr:hypothetical protein [Chthoniobacterales bacterium]
MTVSEMASISGYSRQRLNKLVDAGFSRGVRRKPSGRLEVFDQEMAARWCDHLRKRKTQRHQRNLARIEWRDRLKVRRMMIAEEPLYREVATAVVRETADKTGKYIADKSGFSREVVDDYARDMSLRTVQKLMNPIEVCRYAFAYKGRKLSTIKARDALFDFEIFPETVPWLKSWEDIAREYGCSHATLSAAAKQLPPELRGWAGR